MSARYKFAFPARLVLAGRGETELFIEGESDSTYEQLRSGDVSWWATRVWLEGAGPRQELPIDGLDDTYADQLHDAALGAAYDAAVEHLYAAAEAAADGRCDR